MRTVIRLVGLAVFWGAGVLMWFFYIGALRDWLGFLGIVLGIAIMPGALLFPFVYWIVEQTFPTQYFILWASGLVGLGIAALAGARADDA